MDGSENKGFSYSNFIPFEKPVRMDTNGHSDDSQSGCGSRCAVNHQKDVGDEGERPDAQIRLAEGEYDDTHLKELYDKLTDKERQEYKEKSLDLKNKGNEEYRKKNFDEAISIYTEALNSCPLEFAADRSILYANRAAAYITLEMNDEAISDCTKAIQLNENYIKARLRRAQLFRKTESLENSLLDYKKVLEMDKDNKEARIACATLPNEINERNEKLKTEMIEKLKGLGNLVLQPFGLSTDNFRVVQDPKSGGYSINFQNTPQ